MAKRGNAGIRRRVGPRWTVQQIRDNLAAAARQFRRWGGTNPYTMSGEDRGQFDQDHKELERAVIRSIRAGITNSRIVNSWIGAQRGLGAYDWLRKFKRGHETNLPGRIDEADVWIALNAVPLRDQGEGLSLEEARKELLRLVDTAEWPPWLGKTHWPGEVDRLKSVVRGRLQTKQNLWQRLVDLDIRFPADEPSSTSPCEP